MSSSLKIAGGAVLLLAIFSLSAFFLVHKSAVPSPVATSTPEKTEDTAPKSAYKIIGKSVEGRSIESYSYGTGAAHLLFVGGIHGGYEWNSVLVAYNLIDHLKANPNLIPSNLTIDIIPSLNPDGVYKATKKEGRFTVADVSTDKALLASARFNAHAVDLNRNFNCKWQPKSTWQSKEVSAGAAAFSEPEAKAFKNYVALNVPSAVVFWHSQADGVYASQCEAGILPQTLTLMNTYAKASGYPAIKTFDAYVTTGAAEDWLASIHIPAVTVELKTHEKVEWEQNLLGIKAVIQSYAK